MSMTPLSDPSPAFTAFAAALRAQGFDEVIVREWAPDLVLEMHAHPFDVQARVVRGEFWLTLDDGAAARHLNAGDDFSVAREVRHAERYGRDGATVWVARRHAS